MNDALARALVGLVPAGILLLGSAILFLRTRVFSSLLQLLGSAGLVTVVATHICEALHLFPAMNWGAEHSLGHYVDLGSAVGGLSLFPVGYLLYVFGRRTA